MGLFQETFIEGSIWMIFHEHVYNVCAQVFTQKSKPSDHRCVWSNATRRGSTMARAVSGGFYRWLSFWFGLAVQLLSYFHRWLCFNLFLWTYPNHPHFPWFCIYQIKEQLFTKNKALFSWTERSYNKDDVDHFHVPIMICLILASCESHTRVVVDEHFFFFVPQHSHSQPTKIC